jgi:hypothetical protein
MARNISDLRMRGVPVLLFNILDFEGRNKLSDFFSREPHVLYEVLLRMEIMLAITVQSPLVVLCVCDSWSIPWGQAKSVLSLIAKTASLMQRSSRKRVSANRYCCAKRNGELGWRLLHKRHRELRWK